MTVTRLPYSEDLYQLLRRVNEGFVTHHDSAEVHAPGWSWKQSDMSAQTQDLCSQAFHARLIELGTHQPWGSPAFLSPSGVERLEELYRRHIAEVRGVPA